MNLSNIKYIVITPARDEEAHLQKTIESVVAQTVRPVEWWIVNDGSTDRTGEIIDEYSARYPWIRAVHRTNRGFRKAGGGVHRAAVLLILGGQLAEAIVHILHLVDDGGAGGYRND